MDSDMELPSLPEMSTYTMVSTILYTDDMGSSCTTILWSSMYKRHLLLFSVSMGQRFGLRSRCSAQLLSLPSIFLLLCMAIRSAPSQRKPILPSLFRNAPLVELVTQAKSVVLNLFNSIGPGFAILLARPTTAQERSGTQPSALTQLPTLRLTSIRLLAIVLR